VYAAIALGRIGDLRALPYLIDVLEDSSAEVRRASALALGMLRNNAAVNALMKRLDDEDVEVRKAALEALNDLNFNLRVGDIDKIAKCLNDAEPRVRELATIVLEKGGDNAIEPLLKALKDEVREVRVTALQSILACLAKSKRGEELRKKINEKISGDLADVVLETLEKTQNKAIRKNAIWLLGQISSSRGADPLLKILESGDKDERIIAATALVKIPNVIGKLCELTKHRDEEVRRLVCWISGMIGDERAKEVLNFALNDSSESVRRAAFQAISRVEKFKNYIQ
jgi:HEAT repeat protein